MGFVGTRKALKKPSQNANQPNQCVVFTLYEFSRDGQKKGWGKLSYAFDPMQAAQSLGIDILSFGGHDALRLEELENHHKDPFDRMIISQALNNNMAIMTVDSAFKQYPCRLL